MSKALVCSCEDVTVDDFKGAIEKGYTDVESVKRYTGFGTGICQGKSCLGQAACLISKLSPRPSNPLGPFTPRPPIKPARFALLASLDPPNGPPPAGSPPPLGLTGFNPGRRSDSIPSKASVVIIGGGIMGLALAYNLAKKGQRDVLVLEKGYLCAGASGRNGGGVRMQWSTRTNIELARRSIDLCKVFARDLGVNIWLRQGGYLFLVRTAEGAKRLEQNVRLQNSLGVPTELIGPDAAREIVPQLTAKGIVAAAFNREDGVIFPWPFLWGYASGCAREGIRSRPSPRSPASRPRAGVHPGPDRPRQRDLRRGGHRGRRLEPDGGLPGRCEAAQRAAPARDPGDRAAQTPSSHRW